MAGDVANADISVGGNAAATANSVPLPSGSGQGLRPRRKSGRRVKQGSQQRPAANYDLLGWGLFLTATAAAAMLWAGIGWPVIAAAGFLLLLCFIAVWYVSFASAVVAPPTVPVTEVQVAPSAVVPSPAPAPVSAAAGSPATSPATAPVASPVISPVASPVISPATQMTRKQMRAADPTTGVLPVISVFARKPDPASSPPPARSAAVPAAEPPVPQAPAGQFLQGIDAGTGARDSRRARRAAGRGTDVALPAAAPAAAAPAAAAPAAAATVPIDTAPKDVAQKNTAPNGSASAEDTAPESRWTRTFGPPETGQLPVQQYVAAASALDHASPDRQQRSHSSL